MIAYFAAILLSFIFGGQAFSLTVDHATPFIMAVCDKSSECIEVEELEPGTVGNICDRHPEFSGTYCVSYRGGN